MSNSSFFDFHCPAGGKWYGCAAGSRFVGCCTSDPCTNGCVQGNIRPGGYNISHHGEWPDASCGSASNFFTCSAGDSFWGCCKSNPCAATPPATCAQGDLVPAFLERPEQFNAYASASPSSTPQPSSKSNTGAIAGGVVGGVVGLAIIGAIIFFVLRKQRRNPQPNNNDMGAAAMVPMMKEKPDERLSAQYGGQSPPPTYSTPNPDQGYYQNMDPVKGHHSYHQYASVADGPQELPAEVLPSSANRYSELPGDASNSTATHRFSELPAETTRATELESPRTSPTPLQTEFATDMAKQRNQNQGLGVTIEETLTKK
ncbi:hypothetical protein BKA66DRAFT_122148 [Pyrenochaeta sp. MPI-SDFR-AT-0127]|nr:hypothetical protein BKA66DRAFT_122148 [Pyrenochaeta sp. MPI-SDFR-AT-0127]